MSVMWNSTGFMDREIDKSILVQIAIDDHFKILDRFDISPARRLDPFIHSMELEKKLYHTIRAKFTDKTGVDYDLRFTFDCVENTFTVETRGEILLTFSPWNFAGKYMKHGKNVDLTWVLNYLFP